MEKPLELPDFLPITSDYGFKVTFGNRTNTLFLRKALQALIQSSVPIIEIEFPKNTQEGETMSSRAGIYDLVCRDKNGQIFLVEMQKGHFPGFVQRLRFYGNHQFNLLANKGESTFENFLKIYCIGILGFALFPKEHYHVRACLRDENGFVVDNQTEYIFVELGKFTKNGEDCSSDLDKLIYTMKNAQTAPATAQPEFMNEDWIRAALDALDTRKMSPEEYALAVMSWAREASEFHAEQKRLKEAEEKGEIKGIEKEKMNNIRKLIMTVDWDDVKIAGIFETTPEVVAKIRAELKG